MNNDIDISAVTADGIITIRKNLNISQKAFADKIKVNNTTVCCWENRKHTPRPQICRRIIKVFNLKRKDYPEFFEYANHNLAKRNGTAHITPDDIKAVRKCLKLSQKAFANKIQVSNTTVQNWEAGKNAPLPCTCRKIIRSFGLKKKDYPELYEYADIEAYNRNLASVMPKLKPKIKAQAPMTEKKGIRTDNAPITKAPAAATTTAQTPAIKEPITATATAQTPATKEPITATAAPTDDVNETPKTPTKKRKPLHPVLKTAIISGGIWLTVWIIIWLIWLCVFLYGTFIAPNFQSENRSTMTIYIVDELELIVFLIASLFAAILPVAIHAMIRFCKND